MTQAGPDIWPPHQPPNPAAGRDRVRSCRANRATEPEAAPRAALSHLPSPPRHVPDTIWSKLDLASGCLSRDLGVKMISWKETRWLAAGLPPLGQGALHSTPALSQRWPAWAAHRLAEGQQDLPAQHMEEAGRCGAVDHDPVAVVELSHLKVLRECLGGRVQLGGGLPVVPLSWPCQEQQRVALSWGGAGSGQYSQGRRLSRHCSSAGTSQAWLKSALGPGTNARGPGWPEFRGLGGLSHQTGTWGSGQGLERFWGRCPNSRI